MTVSMLQQIKGKLVVSCQALEGEPLHSDYIMSRMAVAAEAGGAAAIRANGVEDVKAIVRAVSLPVIGIIKRDYADSAVYITPTLREIDELMCLSPQMIAMDATAHPRPGGLSLAELVQAIRSKYPRLLLMADIATLAEAINADTLGFDCIGTTLHGYTAETQGRQLAQDDFCFLREVLAAVGRPVIAEGNVATPAMAARCLALGAHAVVVGGAITRPQQITQRFVQAIGG
ncbi:N-acetylmannosamine-6-phosphate 2-epimerase [Serratia odorifera]|jgi:N-acylglucosamine-6-phosphate 2-epimerase|uniref:Putative N-acetylmannosamine-6-phosphate 2-epimerase n=1 Tax=Serratia odorifera DSM 4582 TaxID=667129 RepID=D4E8G9_SEROD|nr:N-acetylmannosamine-6-phosphate 2-epimerase [Serratia odorifera]EFE93585.1 putative N-acetylmannosamine-6-phosphate epimerase [Serratia odorifera DSM 4582]MBJ2063957.1 N-acetylmannosamine-6-phosphate 2-epimerase [Serratia odorifera]PNK88783.1 putative N-acetylmannosamine-6-phosphate 2-epimerase [Serratia odorifera]RII69423.1 N-acetylmannosamine-6-phosphate 2-epimerase [Serratia odorifera]HEJ9095139.1 N-acetylmannosamine-6-phosphate 2-epimerase [Serratia odorifera]